MKKRAIATVHTDTLNGLIEYYEMMLDIIKDMRTDCDLNDESDHTNLDRDQGHISYIIYQLKQARGAIRDAFSD